MSNVRDERCCRCEWCHWNEFDKHNKRFDYVFVYLYKYASSPVTTVIRNVLNTLVNKSRKYSFRVNATSENERERKRDSEDTLTIKYSDKAIVKRNSWRKENN
jgi:hypothetical protein